MRLILSSCDFRNEHSRRAILDNLGMPIEQCRVLYIPNEKATEEAILSEKFYNRLGKFGFRRENITVFNHYAPELFYDLPIDAIYVSGGNTFGTLDRLRKCGFDREIIRYVQNGAVYIGGSAGAHIVTKSICHLLDIEPNTVGMAGFRGLGLFDGILICHYSAAREPLYEKAIAEGIYHVHTLTDDEFIVI